MKAKTACLWSHNREPTFGGGAIKTLLHEMHAIVFFLSFKKYSFTFENLLLFIMYLITFTLHCPFLSHPYPWSLTPSSKHTLLHVFFFKSIQPTNFSGLPACAWVDVDILWIIDTLLVAPWRTVSDFQLVQTVPQLRVGFCHGLSHINFTETLWLSKRRQIQPNFALQERLL